jgi:hypothetical protein
MIKHIAGIDKHPNSREETPREQPGKDRSPEDVPPIKEPPASPHGEPGVIDPPTTPHSNANINIQYCY